jgi:DNA-binding response OmpR family regulator
MAGKVRQKVLVIEDEETMARLCREELEDEGYDVIVALSGLKGLELFRSATPDIVTLDIKLPDLDGMELLRQMKSLRPQVPVIILTAYDYLYDFMVCDADGYLVKSPDLKELKKKIRAALQGRGPAGELRGPEEVKELVNSPICGPSAGFQSPGLPRNNGAGLVDCLRNALSCFYHHHCTTGPSDNLFR